MRYGEKEILEFVKWAIKDTGGEKAKRLWDDYNNYKCRCESIPIEPPVKPEIADTTKITMWVDVIWNDIFDDDELPLTAAQMNIIGKYINDAKEKIRKQFSV